MSLYFKMSLKIILDMKNTWIRIRKVQKQRDRAQERIWNKKEKDHVKNEDLS